MEEDVTDSWETGPQHADAQTVSAAGSRAPHAEDRVPEHLTRDGSQPEGTGPHSGKTAREIGDWSLSRYLGSYARPDRDEKLVELVGRR